MILQVVHTHLLIFSPLQLSPLSCLLGNIYFSDCNNHRIRKVTVSTGIISTIAGSGGTGSFSGDNGAATSAKLNGPYGVALDSSGISF